VACIGCGVPFLAKRSDIAKGYARYCSQRCYFLSGGETSIERAVRLVLEAGGLHFEQEAQIGPWVVDFLLGWLVIEADGAYWHAGRGDRDARKTADLTARGWVVWRLPEAEIKQPGFASQLRQRLTESEARYGQLPRVR
jgi:very-short-patch-repair endonuclease